MNDQLQDRLWIESTIIPAGISPTPRGDHPKTPLISPQNEPQRRAWFMSIAMSTRPRCPACGGRMLPRGVVVAGDVAWCENCHLHDHSEDLALIGGMHSRGCQAEFTKSRGITFWTPSPKLDDMDLFLRWSRVCLEQRVRTPDLTLAEVRDMMDDQTIEGVDTELDIESQRYPHHDA